MVDTTINFAAMREYNLPVNEGIHQWILDCAYTDWQANKGWRYDDMLENCEKKFGTFARFLVQLGKFNQQVCNGGLYQYWDNGYASARSGGCFSHHDNDELHDWLVYHAAQYLPVMNLKHGEQLLELFNKIYFDVDEEQYTVEEVYCEDEDEYYNEEVPNENYGQPCTYMFDKYESAYYDMNEELMEEVESYLNILIMEQKEVDKESQL